ncbi:MAG: response regulator [Deltaproteobacteria bacterium]|nr:response regulator [Kofleriaceae bacterium]
MADGGRAPQHDPPARILVVDDELYNRDLMVRTFARAGEVVAAADAGEATALLERWSVDVLVTDMALGRSPSGVELAREVRRRWPAVRIVVVTGFDDEPALQQARGEGLVDDVVPKPWQPSALRERVLALVVRP